MSCSNIGRGMAFVGKAVLRLFDEEKIDLYSAKLLLRATSEGVNVCDGNSYEAMTSLSKRCAHCLRKVNKPSSDLIFTDDYFAKASGVTDRPNTSYGDIDALYYAGNILAPQLCRDCYAKLKSTIADSNAGLL